MYRLYIQPNSQTSELPFAVRVFTSIQEEAPKSGIELTLKFLFIELTMIRCANNKGSASRFQKGCGCKWPTFAVVTNHSFQSSCKCF